MSTYRYRDVPLTGSVFTNVALDLVEPGSVIARTNLAKLVSEHHLAHGGLAGGSSTMAAKKSLRDLQERGRVEQAGAKGYWRFLPAIDAGHISEPILFGAGPESVYVYYLPAYRDQAAYLDRNEWPMKIGMTKGDVDLRIRDQAGTSLPEKPIVGMIYGTDDAANAERILHSTLRARERHITNAPGKEWFLTTIAEVKSILDFATGQGTTAGESGRQVRETEPSVATTKP